LIELLGGKCSSCGYKKNFAALEFHHKIAGTKAFELDLRSLSNRTWEKVLDEVSKCILLCANCHAELHHADHLIPISA